MGEKNVPDGTEDQERIRVGVFDPDHPEYGMGAYFTTSVDAQRRAQMFPEMIFFQIFKYGKDPDELDRG